MASAEPQERPRCPLADRCEELVTQWWFENYCMSKDFVKCRHYREKMVERRRPRDWWETLQPYSGPRVRG